MYHHAVEAARGAEEWLALAEQMDQRQGQVGAEVLLYWTARCKLLWFSVSRFIVSHMRRASVARQIRRTCTTSVFTAFILTSTAINAYAI